MSIYRNHKSAKIIMPDCYAKCQISGMVVVDIPVVLPYFWQESVMKKIYRDREPGK